MSGKKAERFHITIDMACNADGSEKLPLCFIGKSMKPHCFKGKTPAAMGFQYFNNKKAWMTMDIFEQYLITPCCVANDLTRS